MEAMARDYSELHVDIMASVASDVNGKGNNGAQTPVTFQSITTPHGNSSSTKRFSLKRFFRLKSSRDPSSSPGKN